MQSGWVRLFKNLADYLGTDSENVLTLLSTLKAAVSNKNAIITKYHAQEQIKKR